MGGGSLGWGGLYFIYPDFGQCFIRRVAYHCAAGGAGRGGLLVAVDKVAQIAGDVCNVAVAAAAGQLQIYVIDGERGDNGARRRCSRSRSRCRRRRRRMGVGNEHLIRWVNCHAVAGVLVVFGERSGVRRHSVCVGRVSR